MRSLLLGLAAAAAMLPSGGALACGDKFLVIGRGVRAQRLDGAVHRASILVYVSPTGGLDTALRETGLTRQLGLAGHTLRSVSSPTDLDASLASGHYDVLLAALADMPSLEARLGTAPSPRPTLLPIIYNPTGEELAAAEKTYRCVMRSPSTKQGYLAVIEEAMAQRKQRERGR